MNRLGPTAPSWGASAESQETPTSGGLLRVFQVLRRRWLLVLAPILVGAVAAYMFADSRPSQYSSSASLLFRQTDLSQPGAVAVDTTRQAATNVDLVSSDEVAQRVSVVLGGGVTIEDIKEDIEISSRGNSDLVTITAINEDPDRAALMANSWAEQYIAFRQDADRAQFTRTIALINQRLDALSPEQSSGSEGQALRARRNDLEITASLQTGNAEVVEVARPTATPVAPRPLQSAAMAGLLGLVVGGLAALIAERLDRRIKEPQQLERILGMPVVGRIPSSRGLRGPAAGRGAAGGARDVPPAILEAFRVVRTNIAFFNVDRDLDTLLVTSAGPGEGKTTISWRLAAAFADSGARTLLLEADLRKPTLAMRLGVPSAPGLTNLLTSQAEPGEVVRVLTDPPGSAPVGPGGLSVMVAGTIPPNPQELLESARMAEVMGALRAQYDMVIIDSPPLLSAADTASLTRHAAGVVVVSRLSEVTVDGASNLRNQLGLLNVRPLGVIINAAGSDAKFAYYGSSPSPAGAREEQPAGGQREPA